MLAGNLYNCRWERLVRLVSSEFPALAVFHSFEILIPLGTRLLTSCFLKCYLFS
ncbi:hypothetical protein HOLleu_19741 [Holothuria leucospilota]|uniref:Uncharacterized protein n=1 Tax=Holothuria leucospilota TaxID=206669 RepID=A0A9Q1C0B0_HOLLE|nr:hypothetical protein HOLleu_19741 [Holothuria leucospilota]